MVRKLKVVEVYTPEEITQADDAEQEQAIEQEPDNDVRETSVDTEEGAAVAESAAAAVEEPSPKPVDVPTTSKILEQVSCPACGKCMSAKNLRYAHQKYCTERAKEEQPPEIAAPEIEIEDTPPVNIIKKVPVKRVKAKAKPQHTEERPRLCRASSNEVDGQPTPPTLENGGILPPGLEAPYKGQMDIEETPEQFSRGTMQDLKEKKKSQYQDLCAKSF